MTATRGTVLEARNVHKSCGRHQVLKGADLEAGPGQLVAVVGENGAGKSTLLRILAGTLGADRGEVRIAGTLGYCPQEPVVNDNLTVGQHLRYFATAQRVASLQRAGELVELLRFGQFAGQVAGALSGGTRQKLNLLARPALKACVAALTGSPTQAPRRAPGFRPRPPRRPGTPRSRAHAEPAAARREGGQAQHAAAWSRPTPGRGPPGSV
jgi:ABC-type cobalamin/Fe3+-siderophores transport system ATPase subunit